VRDQEHRKDEMDLQEKLSVFYNKYPNLKPTKKPKGRRKKINWLVEL
jgi:hypothetical protein